MSRHKYKAILIVAVAISCLCIWSALAGLVALNHEAIPTAVARWQTGLSIVSTRVVAALTAAPSLTVTPTPDFWVATPLAQATTPSPLVSPPPVAVPTDLTGQERTATPTVPATAEPQPEHTATGPPAPGPTVPPAPTRAAAGTPGPTSPPSLTPSPTMSSTPTPTATPTPTRSTFNIMLLGSDRNIPGKGTWRTDVMALTVIDRESNQIGVLALPRDLYVSVPGHEPARINTVDFLGHYTKYPGGGPALLNETLRQNFGFGFDRFIRVDFTGFVELVNILGGIDVDVDCAFEEVFADPELPGGRLLKVSPGWQTMDGHTALLYVRIRHGTTDTDRSRRQLKVLMAIRDKALRLDTLLLIPQLWNNYHTTVQTDLGLTEALDLARVAFEFDPDNIHGRVIDRSMTTEGKTAKGSFIFIPNTRKIREAYDSLLTAPRLVDAGRRKGRCPPTPSPTE